MLEKSERFSGSYIERKYYKRKEYTTLPRKCRKCKHRADYECTKYKTKNRFENRLIPDWSYGRIKPYFCKEDD